MRGFSSAVFKKTKEIAECFSVNTNTVYRLEKQMRETGSVKTRTSQRGRKHALTPEDLQNIDRVVQQEPDITIDEIIDKLGLHVCNETVRKAVIIAIPENNAKNPALQNVNYCVTDFRRTPVRLQICSLQFALCSTAFFALFSGIAIGYRSSSLKVEIPRKFREQRLIPPMRTETSCR